jgi:hypothetical protein
MAILPLLSELLAQPNQDDVLDQEVLPELRYRKVRVTDWKVGGVYRGMSYVVAKMRVESRKILAAIAASGLPDYAFGLVDAPFGIDVTGWCDLVGLQLFGEARIAATYTKRTILLTNASATAYPVNPGDIILLFTATGNRYVLDQAGTIPATGTVSLSFRSYYANDSTQGLQYNDPTGAAIILVTSSYPGVTATNPAPTYSSVAQSGTSVGTVTPSGTPPIGSQHSVAVRIDSTGNAASVQWSTSLDGAAFVPQSGASVSNLGGVTGLNVTLADNGGSPAFNYGSIYYYSTPGSDITVVGRDIESPQDYGTRCKGKLPLINVEQDADGNAVWISPTESGYVLLAKRASSQVVIAFVTLGSVNNEVRIYVAGQGALLSGPTIAAIQSFISSRPMLTDKPVVSSPTTGTVTLGGATVKVKQAYKTSAQQAINRALALYFGGVDKAKPLTVNPKIDHEYVAAIITNTPGVTDFTDTLLTINGVVGDLQMPITPGAFEIPSWSQDIATALTWVVV